jgi:hypothetical protein
MTDRDPRGENTAAPRPTRRRRDDPRDSARLADNEAATSWPHDAESSYSAAAPPKGPLSARRHAGDTPLAVRIEFVRLDGPEGQALRRRQTQIMRKVLRWIADHPGPANP